jgi:hypothetical protein
LLGTSVSIYVFSTTVAYLVATYDVLRWVTVIILMMISAYVWKLLILFDISSFNCGVFELFALLGHYATSVGIFV